MEWTADRLVTALDRKLTRRQLLSILAIAGPTAVAALRQRVVSAQEPPPLFRARTINHVGIAVSDLQRSAAFYQSLFGLSDPRPIAPESYALDFNGHFIMLNLGERAGLIEHFCIGVDGFQAERDGQLIRGGGFDVLDISDRYVDVHDPNGTRVRIAETNFRAECAECPPPTGPTTPVGETPLRATSLNHVSFGVSDLRRSVAFYHDLFGLPLSPRPLNPAGAQFSALDFNECYVSFGLRTQVGVVDHFCFGVDDFDAVREAERLRALGLPVRALTDGASTVFPTIYVNDPDGLNVQIADFTWKSECPTCEPAAIG